jgi:hypothetical protein
VNCCQKPETFASFPCGTKLPKSFCELLLERKMAVFWVVAPCSLVEVYQRFRGPCCLHHQGDDRCENLKSYFFLKIQNMNPDKKSCLFWELINYALRVIVVYLKMMRFEVLMAVKTLMLVF